MFKRKNGNQNSLSNLQTPNHIRESLQQSNNGLIKQKHNAQNGNISIQYRHIPSQYTIIEQSGLSDQCSEEEIQTKTPVIINQNQDKINAIQKKIEQVINLCNQGSKNCTNDTLKLVTQAQKKILFFLTSINKQILSIDLISKPKYFRPISSNIKINKQYNKYKNTQKDINKIIKGGLVNMIDQIQIKTLAEIENLRKTNLMLMKKLNQQIAAHNQQKRRRVIFQSTAKSLVDSLKKYDSHKIQLPQFINQKQNNQQLKLPINNHINFVTSQQTSTKQNSQGISNLIGKQIYSEYPPQGQSYQNLHRTQYGNQVDQPGNSQPYIIQPYPELEIQNQIKRLKLENMQMKQNIENQKNAKTAPIKEQLKNQLKSLRQKAVFYEKLIATSNPHHQSGEIQNLYRQGTTLASQGQKLMRVRSKPQFVTLIGLNDINSKRNQNTYEKSIIKQKWSQQSKDVNYRNQIQPTQYEKIMCQMKKAINL